MRTWHRAHLHRSALSVPHRALALAALSLMVPAVSAAPAAAATRTDERTRITTPIATRITTPITTPITTAAHAPTAPRRVAQALADIDAATLGLRNDLAPARVTALADDPTAWVDADNRLFFADRFDTAPELPRSVTDAASTSSSTTVTGTTPITAQTTPVIVDGAPVPLADTFLLESRPSSTRTLFLDFDGGTVTGSVWNTYWNDNSITANAADFDNTPGTFSAYELATIQHIWSEVAEDYAPFDINVTTKDPGLDAIDRTSLADTAYGTWVLITDEPTSTVNCSCNGLSYIGVFDWYDGFTSHMSYQPAWSFGTNIDNGTIIAHEAGHSLGLSHDGTSTTGYYAGNGNWVPTMGRSYTRAVSQWNNGSYSGANNTEDDVAIIRASVGTTLADDHGNTAAAATSIDGTVGTTVDGIISTRTDVDVFTFTWPGGAFTATASPAAVAPNLDIKLQIRNSTGATVLTTADPLSSQTSALDATGLGAVASASLAAGTYTLWVDGTGVGSPPTSGYTDYGSLGRYRLRIGTRSLTVHTTGPGTGTVTSSSGGINCGTTCTADYSSTSVVTLTATPDDGSLFVGWTGPCYGTSTTCAVTIDRARAAVAVFVDTNQRSLTVTKTGTGTGTVTSSPVGITCGSTCRATFTVGDTVTLTASASIGTQFTGWSGGGCSGTGTCTVTLSSSTTVTATFTKVYFWLMVTKSGTGSGTVTSSPSAITCGTTCSANLPYNGTYTLTATPSAIGSVFSGWSGGGCSGTGTCTVTMTAATTVTATFTRVTHTLTVSTTGTGTGRITSSPAGVDCGTTCSAPFLQGAVVTLTAAPALGMRFDGWSGAGCSGTLTCAITMSTAASVSATFTAIGDTFREFRTPLRLVDTRAHYTGALEPVDVDTAFAPGQTRRYDVTSILGIPAGATMHVNLIAVTPTGTGSLNLYPCASLSSTAPATSFLSYSSGVTVANAGMVVVGSGGGICIRSSAATHVALDSAGWFPAGATFTAFSKAVRLVDTGTATGALEVVNETTALGAGTVRRYVALGRGGIPLSGVAALALNVTAVAPAASGTLKIYPCAAVTDTAPTAISMSYTTATTLSTGAMVVLDPSGGFCVRAGATTNLVIASPGWFGSTGNLRTYASPSRPHRLLDTRSGKLGDLELGAGIAADLTTALAAGTTYRFQLAGIAGLPAAGSLGAVALTLTAVTPSSNGWIKVWACDATTDPVPATTAFNYRTGLTISNLAIVHTSTTGGVCVRSLATTHLVIDATTWFAR